MSYKLGADTSERWSSVRIAGAQNERRTWDRRGFDSQLINYCHLLNIHLTVTLKLTLNLDIKIRPRPDTKIEPQFGDEKSGRNWTRVKCSFADRIPRKLDTAFKVNPSAPCCLNCNVTLKRAPFGRVGPVELEEAVIVQRGY